ncbi:MAG: hypothetical protein IT204_03600 [Fimbriimonadaceae bacterium]|nr:hypothetical protein [Fimbriimonadaceae bacterium]
MPWCHCADRDRCCPAGYQLDTRVNRCCLPATEQPGVRVVLPLLTQPTPPPRVDAPSLALAPPVLRPAAAGQPSRPRPRAPPGDAAV